jgi:hypothetical protein
MYVKLAVYIEAYLPQMLKDVSLQTHEDSTPFAR